ALRRANEFEADSASAELAGKDNAAAALIALELRSGTNVRDYWKSLFKQANDQPAPPASAYAGLGRVLSAPISPDESQRRIEAALKEETGYSDTHPALADRLKQFGYEGVEQAEALVAGTSETESAACYFLRDKEQVLISELDRLWHESVNADWKERHEEIQ